MTVIAGSFLELFYYILVDVTGKCLHKTNHFLLYRTPSCLFISAVKVIKVAFHCDLCEGVKASAVAGRETIHARLSATASV